MPSTLEVKLRTAAAANAGLTGYLGTAPFRWYDVQLDPARPVLWPAITVLLVSTVNQYSLAWRMESALSRVQFTIWDVGAEEARAVETALLSFLDGFNAMNTSLKSPIQANQVVSRRQGGNPQTQPLTFWRTVDAMIFNNEQL